ACRPRARLRWSCRRERPGPPSRTRGIRACAARPPEWAWRREIQRIQRFRTCDQFWSHGVCVTTWLSGRIDLVFTVERRGLTAFARWLLLEDECSEIRAKNPGSG